MLQTGAEPPPSAALQRGRPSGLGTAESRGRQPVLLDGPPHLLPVTQEAVYESPHPASTQDLTPPADSALWARG